MVNFLIYTGVLLVLIFVSLAATSPRVGGIDGYPTGW